MTLEQRIVAAVAAGAEHKRRLAAGRSEIEDYAAPRGCRCIDGARREMKQAGTLAGAADSGHLR
jgi:hypothetical protein